MAHMPPIVPAVATVPWTNVDAYGVSGNGLVDDTAKLQKAINETAGRVLVIPRGKYRVTETLVIPSRFHHIVGEFGGRAADGGTEIVYYGTGPCIQIGEEADGVDWDQNYYLGDQDHLVENLWISHGEPDTALASAGDSAPRYKAGSYGIWDWYGGGLRFQNVGIERFEANFVGIQSDISQFDFVTSLYSKWGIYLGPRSDQFTINTLYAFFCDRAVTVDRASGTRIVDAQIVGCGTSTSAAIEIRRGSTQTSIVRPWFEHLQGYAGVDQLAFVSAGVVDGYGAGGSISSAGDTPTTAPCRGVSVDHPYVYTQITGAAYHTRYLVAVGKCQRLAVHHPAAQVGSSLTNLDALAGVPSGQTPTASDTQVLITGVSSDGTVASFFTNVGGGDPAWRIDTDGGSGSRLYGYGTHTIAQNVALGEAVSRVHAISGGLTITNGSGGNTTIQRNDGDSHAARPALTISNTGTGAIAHRAALLLSGRDSGGTVRTATVQAEGGLISILSDNNNDVVLNAGTTGHVRATSTLVAQTGMRLASTTGPRILSGTGTPEAVVTAPVGSLYVDVAGSTGTTLYVKETGTGNTGWVAK